MAKYQLTNKALEDLSDIWDYSCETWSEEQADQYYSTLLDFIEDLAQKSKIGKKYDDVNLNLLGYKVNQHIIFYQVVSDKEIEVVRILHSRMDLKNGCKTKLSYIIIGNFDCPMAGKYIHR